MKKVLTLLFIFTIIINICQIAYADTVENKYGSVNAWFNGKEGTVENIQLNINEPAEIKVEIISKISGNIHFELENPLITESYEVISGPSSIDQRNDVFNIEPGWKETFVWKIKPTGEWTNGNAPINLFVQFHKGINDDETVEFTIANPYILDEQYSGPRSTAVASTGLQDAEGSPGFVLIASLMAFAAAVVLKRSW